MYDRIKLKANLKTAHKLFNFLQAEIDLEAAADNDADIIAPLANEEPVEPISAAGFNQNCPQPFRCNSSNRQSNRGSGFRG